MSLNLEVKDLWPDLIHDESYDLSMYILCFHFSFFKSGLQYFAV